MSDIGWIPAYRKLFEREDWMKPTKKHPAGTREAWLDLCQKAQRRSFDHGGEPLERGEVLVSLSWCAKRWAWSIKRVRWFFNRLICGTMIARVRGTPNGTVYHIVNYDTYAIDGHSKGHSKGHSQGHPRGIAGAPEQERRKKNTTSEGGRKHSLPDDWTPTNRHVEVAGTEGVDLQREAMKFREHAAANGRRQLDWNRSFTMWLMRAAEYRTNGSGRGAKHEPERRNLQDLQ